MSDLQQLLVEALSQRVLDTLRNRGPGHCLQIPHVPSEVADSACRAVSRELEPPDAARVVTERPKRDWQASPAKVVELRNLAEESGGRLALFVPAGARMAAEDSFGRSTFEVIDAGDLYEVVLRDLQLRLQEVAPDLSERAESITGLAKGDGRFSVGGREAASYLMRLVQHPSEEELGGALVELGLLPDLDVAHEEPADLSARLARNLEQMNILTDMAPPADRIQRLPLSPELPGADLMSSALAEALADGTVDRYRLARRLDRDGDNAPPADFAPMLSSDAATGLTELSILDLAGDLTKGDPPTITKENASVKIRYRCQPSAATVAGLRELRLELLRVGDRIEELAEAGVEAAKRGASLPRKAEASWSMRIPTGTDNVEPGLHRLRLQAVDEDNLVLKEAMTEPFLIGEDIAEAELPVTDVASVSAAEVESRAVGDRERRPGPPLIGVSEGRDQRVEAYSIRYAGAPQRYRLSIARAPAQVERYTLEDPRSIARYVLSLDSGEVEETLVPDGSLGSLDDFLRAREALFADICSNQYPIEGEVAGPLTALCDLRGLREPIARYLDTWAQALASADAAALRTLLSVDQIELSDSDLSSGVLVGPTHPLRIAWLERYQRALSSWSSGETPSAEEAAEVKNLLATLAPGNLPHVVFDRARELRYLEPIDLSWGLWAPPGTPDVNALAAEVRMRLGLGREQVSAVDVRDLVARIRRYLAAHPYVDLLKINFIQPGHADIVLRALLALQENPSTADLRYVVRLFATELSRSELGRALDDFMSDPEGSGARRDAADPFLASTDDPLTPKLTYSKHKASDLLAEPRRFPSHLTFFLDWFDLDAVPVPPLADRRSLFADGLIVDPVAVYRAAEKDLNPQWDEHIVVPEESDDPFLVAMRKCARGTARLLDPEAAGAVPAVRLQLDRVRRSILDAVHRTSDWVVVIDPIFGDDYLDSPPASGETPRYLIDASDPGAPGFGRRIVVSTRSREELGLLLAPIAQKYALDIPEDRIEVLLDALRTLSPGLPLRLLNNRTQALEAFSLALASLMLAAQGVLRRALVLPVDMHRDLFRPLGTPEPDKVDLRRTDLAVLRLDPDARRISVSLVEIKARGQLPAEIPQELVEQFSAQLENSRTVLRDRLFAVGLRDRADSLASGLMLRRLTRVLDRYLERATRHGVVDEARLTPMREFVASLDRGYSIIFDKHALIFDLEGPSRPPERLGDVRVTRVGRDEIADVLARTQTPVGTHVVASGETELVRTLLGADEEASDESAEAIPPLTVTESAGQTPAAPPGPDTEGEPAAEPPAGESDGPRPEDVAVLGATPDSRAFGVIGRVHGSGERVAFDVDGTNVVSVFGVQGSGKSYGVGNLIETALVRDPALNRLAHPLAAVVFHYDTNQAYVPEYTSMSQPNNDPRETAELEAEYGTHPVGLPDVRVLVPAELIDERRSDYPDLPVEGLVMAPDELTVNDWRLLMGVQGGDQLYVKAMGTLFRSLRQELTVRSLKREVAASSSLSQAQKALAQARIEFVEGFVADGGNVSNLIRPGRLVVVDVRDPWMEQENALALFMVMLRLCSQARDEHGRSFNKLVVFDEAHKYMSSPQLTGAIVETVREMRHSGTTVVLASQDPPSLPRDVLELSSVMLAHRFTSPKWLQHIAHVNEGFARRLTPAQLATLSPGEAFAWSSGPGEFRVPQRVRMRPRLTRHGGGTRRSADG